MVIIIANYTSSEAEDVAKDWDIGGDCNNELIEIKKKKKDDHNNDDKL